MTFIRRVELFNPNQQAERLFSEMFGSSIGKTLELGVQKPMAFLRCFLKSSHWMDASTTASTCEVHILTHSCGAESLGGWVVSVCWWFDSQK